MIRKYYEGDTMHDRGKGGGEIKKRYVKYFMVVEDKTVTYVKHQSESPFLVKESIAELKKSYPKAKEIKHIKKKAGSFLNILNL